MTTNPTADFSSDRPLTDGREDRLNRTPFIERVAGVLLGLPKALAEAGKRIVVFIDDIDRLDNHENLGNTFVAGSNAGVTFSQANQCFVVDSPQQLYNCESQNPYLSRIKLNGSYPLPKGFQAALVYQNLPAAVYGAAYTVSTTAIAPSLGRQLAGGTRNVTIELLPTGSGYLDERVNPRRTIQQDLQDGWRAMAE